MRYPCLCSLMLRGHWHAAALFFLSTCLHAFMIWISLIGARFEEVDAEQARHEAQDGTALFLFQDG